MLKTTLASLLVILGLLLVLPAATPPMDQPEDFKVVVWERNEPPGLNPYTSSGATATYIKHGIFQRLLDFDYGTLELVPVLARSRPEITVLKNGGMEMTFEIRPEATWDNGSAITAEDVEFSLKAIVCPRVENDHIRPLFTNIRSVKIDPENERRITVIWNEVYFRAEYTVGFEAWIIPKYAYDPNGVLDKFDFAKLRDGNKVADNAKIIDFAKEFNSTKHSRQRHGISGSGAYTLDQWEDESRIVLKRKSNWWGDDVNEGRNGYFEAYPSTIVYEFIPDEHSALVALTAGRLDVMKSIPSLDFRNDLSNNPMVRKRFNLMTPKRIGYSYLGLNVQNEKLADVRVRQALAHLVRYDQLMRYAMFDYCQRVVGPVNPLFHDLYNHSLAAYTYDPEKAKKLLDKAGWIDSDADGTRDKVINGKKVDLTIEYIYNSGNVQRESMGLSLQESFKSVGINLDIRDHDWATYLEKLRGHDFEMNFGGWVGDPAPEDFRQIFSTAAANGGANYTNFGNIETDKLIDEINATLDEKKRAKLVKEFQTVLHHEVSYIFLWSPFERIAVNKRFANASESAYKPGYWVPGFRLRNQY